MDTIEVLDELLPGFQQFLSELQKFELTRDLQDTLAFYLKQLKSYINDHAEYINTEICPKLSQLPPPLPPPLPGSQPVAPPLPTSTPKKEYDANDGLSVDEIAAQRTLSWQYSNVSSSKGDNSSTAEQLDDVYETPITEHEALHHKTSLPISDQEEEYEIPTSCTSIRTVTEDGKVYDELVDEEHERVINDDDDVYENPEDQGGGPINGGWSDASGSYESFDSDEFVDEQQTIAPSLPERDVPVQTRNSKAEQFKIRCENDPYIIHYGILSIKSFSGTLSRISLGKWSRKYCTVNKGVLYMYSKPSDKVPSKSLTLFGYNITEDVQDGKNEFVFGIHHQGQTSQYFATTSQEKLQTWIKVLQEEATNADNIPSENNPHSSILEVTDAPSKKDKKKLPNMLKRRSRSVPVFTEDNEGNLAGVVNVYSPVHGETKWKERFCLVTNQIIHIYKDTSGEKLVLSQPLQGLEIGQGKQAKRQNTLTLFEGDTTYLYIEAVNQLDHGKLLRKLIQETGFAESLESDYIMPEEQMEPPVVQNPKLPSIFSLLQRFENSAETEGKDSVYLEMDESIEKAKPETPTINVEEPETDPVYQNNPTASAWLKAKLQPKKSPNLQRKDIKDKEKKEKEKEKKKKEKKKKEKGKKTEEPKDDADSNADSGADNSSKVSVEPLVTEVVQKKNEEKVSEVPKMENKFVKSDKKHLLDIDRLQGERKLLLQKREDLRIKKTELRGRKNACQDEAKKAKIEKELNAAIQEWTASSKELTEMEEKIARASKGDENLNVEKFSNKTSGRASPMLQRAISSKNVMARAKMFEAMGKE
ncbi:uncharacterized protein [Antedon mediterranea]|uniref:uncharacterized protein n=1 Tax=Antedon mediterranea TaxID=105859 RepID=UPI003AF7FD8F